jgi:hypothetical protein
MISQRLGELEKCYRILTYTSKNDFYVLNVDKTSKKEVEDVNGSIDSDEDEVSTKSHDSSQAKPKKKLRATTIDTIQLNIAQKQFTKLSKL